MTMPGIRARPLETAVERSADSPGELERATVRSIVEADGVAVFRNDRLVGWLNEDQSQASSSSAESRLCGRSCDRPRRCSDYRKREDKVGTHAREHCHGG